jgi:hypothetical protein
MGVGQEVKAGFFALIYATSLDIQDTEHGKRYLIVALGSDVWQS